MEISLLKQVWLFKTVLMPFKMPMEENFSFCIHKTKEFGTWSAEDAWLLTTEINNNPRFSSTTAKETEKTNGPYPLKEKL